MAADDLPCSAEHSFSDQTARGPKTIPKGSDPPVRGVAIEGLTRAWRAGLIGGAGTEQHVDHALTIGRILTKALDMAPEGVWVDLGSGGGIPGVVLALQFPKVRMLLIDASQRRCTVLDTIVAELDLAPRVAVHHGRAEDLARGALRGGVDLVVARAFGSPAATAECGVGFLRVGGRLVVSEPPMDGSGAAGANIAVQSSDDARKSRRWPTTHLADLGFAPAEHHFADGAGLVAMAKLADSDRWPRRNGLPGKRPLW